MTKTDQHLIQLLRASYQDIPLSINVSEEELLSIVKKAEQQGVVGLVFDTLSKLPKEKIYYSKAYHKAMSSFMKMESQYPAYKKSIEDLGAFFHENNLQMLLFKGEDMRRNWMKPELRPCGDIDISLRGTKDQGPGTRDEDIDDDKTTKMGWGNKTTEDSEYTENMSGSSVSSVVENNINASVVGDLLVREQLGIVVEASKPCRHSHFTFQGQSVENHHVFGDGHTGRKRDVGLEKCLQDLAWKDASLNTNYHECTTNYHELDIDKTTDTGGVNKEPLINTNLHESNLNSSSNYSFPSSDFNAVFLLWHLTSHFTYEAVSLRQLYDWLMFLRVHHTEIDWQKITKIYEDYNLTTFSRAVNGALIKYLGMDAAWVPPFEINEELSDRFMEEVMKGEQRSWKHLDNILYYPRSAWKFRLTGEGCWVKALMQSVWEHLKVRG